MRLCQIPCLLLALAVRAAPRAQADHVSMVQSNETTNTHRSSSDDWMHDPDSVNYVPPPAWHKDEQGFMYIPHPEDGHPYPTRPNSTTLGPTPPTQLFVWETVTAIAAIVGAVLKAVQASGVFNEEKRRGRFVEGIVNQHIQDEPDRNVFVFHRFQGFTWRVEDHATVAEATAPWKRKDQPAKTEYFGIVSFKGPGELNKHGKDGGWGNWGWWGANGHERVGNDIVKFF